MKNFSIGDTIHKAWKLTENNFGFLLRLTIIGFGLSIISNYINRVGAYMDFPNNLVFVFSGAALSLIGVLVHIAFVKFGLQLIDGTKPKMSNLLSYTNYFWRFIGGALLYGAAVGIVFFVSLAIIIFLSLVFHSHLILAVAILAGLLAITIGIQYFFTIPLIVDQNLGPIEAMKKSRLMTRGIRIDLFAFLVVLVALNILGAVAMVIGLLVSVPVTFLAYLLVYRQVLKGGSPPTTERKTPSTLSPIQSQGVPVHVL